jgi:hypothetical protein
MQQGAKDKQGVDDQMLQNRLGVLMLRKGLQQLVEQLRKVMLQRQEQRNAWKWMEPLDLQM